MDIDSRISSFLQLGTFLRNHVEDENHPYVRMLSEASHRASSENPWFIPEFITLSLNSLGHALEKENLLQWAGTYLSGLQSLENTGTIGVVMAGNVPAVGFHDFFCVLMAGYKIKARLSSSDRFLIPAMAEILVQIDPRWREKIEFRDGKLENFDAVIATGNDNTSRYFDYYFGKYPHIIRKNRSGIALLDGSETDVSLGRVANDIMLYFGMGCRSVSKIYVPAGYNFDKLKEKLASFAHLIDHHKYANNYNYRKSIFLMNKIPFIDTGLLLVREDPSVHSPIAVLNYQYYNNLDDVTTDIQANFNSIQCIVSENHLPFSTVLPGKTQFPALWDYSDHVDTMNFLLSCFSQ